MSLALQKSQLQTLAFKQCFKREYLSFSGGPYVWGCIKGIFSTFKSQGNGCFPVDFTSTSQCEFIPNKRSMKNRIKKT